ncbi:MAG: sulfurtransferase [Ahniella sp.]|nr:sulfurtransferase [Ahniella sp.]
MSTLPALNSPLIDAGTLHSALGHADLLVVDCRFDLTDPDAGRTAWLAGHIAGAVYADLNRDLSDLTQTERGRHPLPDPSRLANTLSRLGFRREQLVVAYDQANGAYAARLWWMLRWLGHERVAVLDGGFAAAKAAGLPIESGEVDAAPSPRLDLSGNDRLLVDFAELDEARQQPERLLIDARGAERYRGEVEPLDPVAGHIPGAINRPFALNLDSDQRFKSPSDLRTAFEALLGHRSPDQVIHQCGSGVTACHNLLAMELAGLPGSRLFAPSWSGWVADRSRPVAKGQD